MSTSQKQPTKPASIEHILDLQYQFGVAFRKLPEARVKALLKDKKLLQQLIQKAAKELKLPVQSEQIIAAIPTLESYYKKVFGIDIPEIAEMEFPEHTTLQSFMAFSPKHDEDQMIEALKVYFKINAYKYQNPIAQNIDRVEEERIQKRPSGLYIGAHSNENEPDAKHRGKAYDDAVAEKLTFAKANEYLPIWGYKKFTERKNMDTKGWTRTSSLWLDGYLVSGYWDDSYSKLYMYDGYRGYRFADNGPRELFLTL